MPTKGRDLIMLGLVTTAPKSLPTAVHLTRRCARAIAGAKGNVDARIFTTLMQAELLSIAGVQLHHRGTAGRRGRPVP